MLNIISSLVHLSYVKTLLCHKIKHNIDNEIIFKTDTCFVQIVHTIVYKIWYLTCFIWQCFIILSMLWVDSLYCDHNNRLVRIYWMLWINQLASPFELFHILMSGPFITNHTVLCFTRVIRCLICNHTISQFSY